jgi:hypothetical protein
MLGGVDFQPTGYPGELVTRQGIRDYHNTPMGPLVIKELLGKADEIVSVSGDQTPFLARRKFQLLPI